MNVRLYGAGKRLLVRVDTIELISDIDDRFEVVFNQMSLPFMVKSKEYHHIARISQLNGGEILWLIGEGSSASVLIGDKFVDIIEVLGDEKH